MSSFLITFSPIIIKYLDYRTYISFNLISKEIYEEINKQKEEQEKYYQILCKADYKIEKLKSKEDSFKELYMKLVNMELKYTGYCSQLGYDFLFKATLKIKKNKNKIKGSIKWMVNNSEGETSIKGKIKNGNLVFKEEKVIKQVEDGGLVIGSKYELKNIDNIAFIGNWIGDFSGSIYFVLDRFESENKVKKYVIEKNKYEGFYSVPGQSFEIKKEKLKISKEIKCKLEEENKKLDLVNQNNNTEINFLFGEYLIKVIKVDECLIKFFIGKKK
jgi:hypothetical protein